MGTCLDATGTVVASLQPTVAPGRLATINRDDAAVTVVQDGDLRAQWTPEQATATFRQREVEQRYTPAWATALGLLSLPLFGLGLIFFCIRGTRLTSFTRVTVLVGGLPMVSVEDVGTVCAVAAEPIRQAVVA